MQRIIIPILIDKGNKKELRTIDVTDFSITRLSELKETILKEGVNTDCIIVLDKLIREKAEEITMSNDISKKSYIRRYKQNKKETRQRKRTKSRRR